MSVEIVVVAEMAAARARPMPGAFPGSRSRKLRDAAVEGGSSSAVGTAVAGSPMEHSPDM